MTSPPPPTARRISVVLDASRHCAAALKAAATWASGDSAELQGLFVEDVDLLNLAALPFAREISHPGGIIRPLDMDSMEHTLQEAAEAMRQAVSELAQRAQLPWSFQVIRGPFSRSSIGAALQADLLVIGHWSGSVIEGVPSGRGPVMALVDESQAGGRVLQAAIRLARHETTGLVLILRGETLRGMASRIEGIQPVFAIRCAATPTAILQAAIQWQARFLLMPLTAETTSESAFNYLASKLPCPLALCPDVSPATASKPLLATA